jgi:hypothetical protein
MPAVQCPIDGCAFATDDIEVALAIALLNIHATTHAPAAAGPTHSTRPRAPRLERPRVDCGIEAVVWNNFVRRWALFRSGSDIDDGSAPHQLFECATDHLGDIILKADPAITSKSVDEVLRIMRQFAVIPVATSVLRSELLQLHQAPDEQFRAFAARAQGKAETCSFTTDTRCSCGVLVVTDYTEEMTRDVLLDGIADTDIRRKTLGTAAIHKQPIADIIAMIESKEMARNALPSSSLSAISSFKRSNLLPEVLPKSQTPSLSDKSRRLDCPICMKVFAPFSQGIRGWNSVPHKLFLSATNKLYAMIAIIRVLQPHQTASKTLVMTLLGISPLSHQNKKITRDKTADNKGAL